jgi:hypothetical protein
MLKMKQMRTKQLMQQKQRGLIESLPDAAIHSEYGLLIRCDI